MIARQPIDIDTDRAVAEALAKFGKYIQVIARRMAWDNPALAADLEQEAGITLWKLDPTRFDESDARYVRGALFKRMQQVLRADNRATCGGRAVSLDGMDWEEEEEEVDE